MPFRLIPLRLVPFCLMPLHLMPLRLAFFHDAPSPCASLHDAASPDAPFWCGTVAQPATQSFCSSLMLLSLWLALRYATRLDFHASHVSPTSTPPGTPDVLQ